MKIEIIKNKSLSDFESWSIWECEPSTFNWEYEEVKLFEFYENFFP